MVLIVEGVRRTFLKYLNLGQLSPRARQIVEWLGVIGTCARGIVFGLAGYGLDRLYGFLAASSALATPSDLRARASEEAFLAIHLWLKLSAYGAGIALFQSRLAHAGYTAAPPAVWPESASAEAIANAAPYTAR